MLMRDCCAITYREKFCIQRLDSEFYVVPQFETVSIGKPYKSLLQPRQTSTHLKAKRPTWVTLPLSSLPRTPTSFWKSPLFLCSIKFCFTVAERTDYHCAYVATFVRAILFGLFLSMLFRWLDVSNKDCRSAEVEGDTREVTMTELTTTSWHSPRKWRRFWDTPWLRRQSDGFLWVWILRRNSFDKGFCYTYGTAQLHFVRVVVFLLQSPYALEAADCNWQILRGKRIHQILCSKFCNNKLLQQYNELWASSNAAKKDPASDEESHLRHCTGQSDHSEATTKPDVQETLLDYVWHEVGSFGGKVQLVGETSATERQNSLARFIAERVSERVSVLQEYSVSCKTSASME